MKNCELAIALSKVETEEDVISLLQNQRFWANPSMWRPLGDFENNMSIVGAQQGNPDAAFVEKIINSIDACLMKECLKRGIDPSGPNAPQSMEQAVNEYYGIQTGGLKDESSSKKAELAKNIVVAATGKMRGQFNLCIADQGEGQTPKRMPETILSLNKSNKITTPFVQGKFNMGGTGALAFCGKHNMQLIISRRCPDIPNISGDDTFNLWSFTIIRKEPAKNGRRVPMYTYLTDPSGKMLTFDTKSLPIVPLEHKTGIKGYEYEPMTYGTFIKLYNYQLEGYKSVITYLLYKRLSILIPNLALPVRLRDTRDYNGNTNATTLAGIITRLHAEDCTCLEPGFPCSSQFMIDGQKIICTTYLMKDGAEKTYRPKNEGILITLNGQSHDIIQDDYFSRLNLSYIRNSILVIVDCTAVDADHQAELFMTSRDRLRNSSFTRALKDCIEKELRENADLKKAANERRAAALNDKIEDDKPLKAVLENILKKSPVLSKIFIEGKQINSPFNIAPTAGQGKVFHGKLHPTFFKIKGKLHDGKLIKNVPCNTSFRVQFDTDVHNNYFGNTEEPGTLILKMDGVIREDLVQHLSLSNGQANLTVHLPEGATDGDTHIFETEIQDEYIVQHFENSFYVNVTKAEEPRQGGSGQLHQPIDPRKKGNQQLPTGLNIPEVRDVHKNQWSERRMDNRSVLSYMTSDDGGDFFLNLDNDYLLTELKGIRNQTMIDLTKARFKYSMALIGMSIVSYFANQKDAIADIDQEVRRITTMIAPVLIPMLESMADLTLEEPVQVA